MHILQSRDYFRGENFRTFCARVALDAQQTRLAEAGGAEFIQEGARPLRSGNSSKPICPGLSFRWQRL